MRELWAKLANAALEKGGHEARIDHHRLEAQGITERLPQWMEKNKATLAFGNDIVMMKEGRPTPPPSEVTMLAMPAPEITRTSILMMFRIIGYSLHKPRFFETFPMLKSSTEAGN